MTQTKQPPANPGRFSPNIDARGYLEKFYHLIVVLPEPNREGSEHALERFLENIFSELPSDIVPANRVKGGQVHQDMVRHLMILKSRKGITLRKLERLATQIAVVYASTRDSQLRLASMIADLCLMKSDTPELYRMAREGSLKLPELESFLPYKKWFDENPEKTDYNLVWAANVWRYVLGSDELLGGQAREDFAKHFGRFNLRTPSRMLGIACDWIDGFAFPVSAGG